VYQQPNQPKIKINKNGKERKGKERKATGKKLQEVKG
jgi:hypothetical protein